MLENNLESKFKDCLTFEYDNEKHYIGFVEYNEDKTLYQVITYAFIDRTNKGIEPYWRPYFWDCFAEQGDTGYQRLYNSGSGGEINVKLNDYVDNTKPLQYWHSKDVQVIMPSNNGIYIKLDELIEVETYGEKTRNPFEYGEITDSHEYCEECEYYSTEYCREHQYEDDEGNLRYYSDDRYVD